MEDYITIEDACQFQDLENCAHFRYLNILSSANIADFSKLKDFKNLEQLYLIENSISDLNPLSELTKLRILNLERTPATNFSPLADLSSLECLSLCDTRFCDLSPLSDLNLLQELYLNRTAVSDLHSLNDLPSLSLLELRETRVGDLSPLNKLNNLDFLDISETDVEDLSCLNAMTSLSRIIINDMPHLKSGSKYFSLGDELIRPTDDYKDFFKFILHPLPENERSEFWSHFQGSYVNGFYCALLKSMDKLCDTGRRLYINVDWKDVNSVTFQLNEITETLGLKRLPEQDPIKDLEIEVLIKKCADWLSDQNYDYFDWDTGGDEFIGFVVQKKFSDLFLNAANGLNLKVRALSSS